VTISIPETTSRFVDNGDVRLHVVEAGSGPAVVLLHGFPEFWYSWRNQIGPLVAAGFRVIMPDLRGYNLSSHPNEIAAYTMDKLVSDVDVIARSAGGTVHLVGHDWGGAIAWYVAATKPAWLKKLVVLNCAHPVSLRRAMRSPRQIALLWYMAVLQLPILPEVLVTQRRYGALRAALRGSSARMSFPDAVIEKYIEAWSRPGAIRGMINYYRAMRVKYPKIQGVSREPACPILAIWGERDPVFTKESMKPPAHWKNVETARLPDAGHFPQADAPDEVNRLLINFLSK